MTEYLGQVGPGMCCVPIAMCNALRFWGLAAPVPDTTPWEIMVEIAACRYGATIHDERVAEWLGLVRVPTSLAFLRRGERLPAMMSLHSPDAGFHAALVIETRKGKRPTAPDLHFVNYKGTGEGAVLEWVEWDEVAWHDCNQKNSLGWWLVPRGCYHGGGNLSPGSPGVTAFVKARKEAEARKARQAKKVKRPKKKAKKGRKKK